MKIQCACGAKYEIIVTRGMPPVQFVCANCGQDYSTFINDLVRRELGEGLPVATLVTSTQPQIPSAPTTPVAPVPPAPQPAGSHLKISIAQPASAQSSAAIPETSTAAICAKHHEPAAEQCVVCKKPICPKCMKMFGYFCSPFCKNKAADLKLDVPVFAGRGDLMERRFWRKVGAIFAVVGVSAVLFLGVWTWYACYGSVPHVIFSTRFDDISHSGASFIVSNQIVFLHGGTLARYDLKTKKQIWSLDLVTKQQIADAIKQKSEEEAKAEYSDSELPRLREKHTRIALEETLSLHIIGKNVWVARENELTHYDWDSGKILQQITVTNGFGEFSEQGDDLVTRNETGETRVNLETGEMQTTAIAGMPANSEALMTQNAAAKTTKSSSAGLPLSPYGDASQPINSQKVNQQMQHLTPAGRIALPALIAGNLHQQQIFKEMESDNPNSSRKNSNASPSPEENFDLVPAGDNFLLFGTKLVKANMVERNAMKAPPKKSALDSGNLTTANEGDAVNEQLNELQRNNGGGTVTEDQSIYQVTVRKQDSPDAAFTTNVVGQPQLFALKTVNVITGSKTIIVLDKSNKKLWQTEMVYTIPQGHGELPDEKSLGEGPVVERDGTLYVFDATTLAAFDISNGNARWRLPSVGINGLFFDDKGMIYLSTSTASLDKVKYSKQIDLNNPSQSVLMKIDPQMGKTLWSIKSRGNLCYLSGNYIYTYYGFDPGDQDENNDPSGIFQPAASFITRINPKNGRVMWEHSEARAPVNVKFDRNTIQLIFKKEVEVLHYLSF